MWKCSFLWQKSKIIFRNRQLLEMSFSHLKTVVKRVKFPMGVVSFGFFFHPPDSGPHWALHWDGNTSRFGYRKDVCLSVIFRYTVLDSIQFTRFSTTFSRSFQKVRPSSFRCIFRLACSSSIPSLQQLSNWIIVLLCSVSQNFFFLPFATHCTPTSYFSAREIFFLFPFGLAPEISHFFQKDKNDPVLLPVMSIKEL